MAKNEDKLTASPEMSHPRALSSSEIRFVEAQNHCALCNSALTIKVESYLEDFYLREEAECPTCKIKTRVKNHKIQ